MKPQNRKAYGSIGHLLGSRIGEHDKFVSEGEHRIFTEKLKDKSDTIIILEKMDGSCCAVCRTEDDIVAITRKGHDARTSPYEQHHLFADWVDKHRDFFMSSLPIGWRLVGEWMAQAHGTCYRNLNGPFYAFDLFNDLNERQPFNVMRGFVLMADFMNWVGVITSGPVAPEVAWKRLSSECPEAEGLIYRRENGDKVLGLAKWVRPDYVAGKYLPEISGCPRNVWNWRPDGVPTGPYEMPVF